MLRLTVPAGDAELAADLLWSAGASAVEEQPGEGVVVLRCDVDEAALRALPPGWHTETVDEPEGWRDGWREFAKPVRVGRVLVRPPWVEAEASEGIELLLDGGSVFGTGAHPSTTLALALLDEAVAAMPGASVLDIGCGSGALSIAAALLGAARVVAIDIDEEAVATTRRNAEANGVAEKIEASTTPVTEVGGGFEIVVANLGSPAVVDLAPAIAARAGHTIILSGLLADRWRHVPPAYSGFELSAAPADGEWRALSMTLRHVG